MHVIIYTSDYNSSEPVEKVLSDIVSQSKNNNPLLDVTGVLFFHNNKFLQVIEGEQNELTGLFDKIKQDPRHKNIYILVDEPIVNASFKDWNMDSFDLDSGQFINNEEIDSLKRQFCQTCLLDPWLLIQVIKDALKNKKPS